MCPGLVRLPEEPLVILTLFQNLLLGSLASSSSTLLAEAVRQCHTLEHCSGDRKAPDLLGHLAEPVRQVGQAVCKALHAPWGQAGCRAQQAAAGQVQSGLEACALIPQHSCRCGCRRGSQDIYTGG